MAYAQISNIIPQYENYPNYWLKAYEQGTTTPKVMATDSTGTTTAAKFELNANGFPITSGSALVIPYIDGAYDLWLFPTEAEADANDTGSAIQVADNINPNDLTGLTINGNSVIDSSTTFTSIGSGTTTVPALAAERVSAKDFGATGDGATDDTTAIQNALTALTSADKEVFYTNEKGGTLYFPAGVYIFSGELVIPEFVNIEGAGKGATVFKANGASAKITYGSTSAAFSTAERGGVSSGFTVDGNDVATGNLFHVGFVVERGFHDIDVVNSLGNGLVVEAAQNINFHDFGAQHNGGTDGSGSNAVFDYGAGNIRFYGAEINRPGEYNIKFLQSGTSPSGAFSVPTDIRFYGGMIERWEDSLGAGNLTSLGTIYHGAGRVNRFIDCDISLTALPDAASMVTVRKDGAGAGSPFYFHNCSFHGTRKTSTHDGASNASVLSDSTANFGTDTLVGLTVYNNTDGSSGTITANTSTTVTATLSGGTDNDWDDADSYTIPLSTVFDVDNAVTVTLTGKNFFENHHTIFKIGDDAFVDVDKLLLSAYDNIFENQSGGTKTQDQILANRNLVDVIQKDVKSTAGTTAYSLSVSGETNPRWEWFPNQLKLGSGSAPTDTTISRTSQYGVTVLNIDQPIKVNDTVITINAGTGSPEGSVNGGIGSIYLRTDGGASTSMYVKESGAGTNTGWIAK